ncbi:MAG: SCO family protein [Planctomycetota bacterium]
MAGAGQELPKPVPAEAAAPVHAVPFWIWPAASLVIAAGFAVGMFAIDRRHQAARAAAHSTAGDLPPCCKPDTLGEGHAENMVGAVPPVLKGREIPDFAFTERSGRTIRRADLLGHWCVIDFIFTNCAGSCPIMTGSLRRVQDTCKDLPKLLLVSITVDPDRDTPEQLSSYARSQGADPQRWLFLTGKEKALADFSHQAFLLAAARNPNTSPSSVEQEFTHSTRVIELNPQGEVVAMYTGTDPDQIQALIADLRKRAGAAPLAPAPTAAPSAAASTPAERR